MLDERGPAAICSGGGSARRVVAASRRSPRITGLRAARSAVAWPSCAAAMCADAERVRRPGGGRKPLTETDPSLLDDLRALVEPATRGDPQVAAAVDRQEPAQLGRRACRNWATAIGHNVVGELLHELGYSLQANRKTREGTNHPDRDAQFRYINDQVKAALAAGEPAISVDTKKKELVGDFKNAGREWRPKGAAGRSAGPRLPHPRAGPRRALRGLRHRRQCRLGQRRHRPRHRQLRGQRHPSLVAADGRGSAIPTPTQSDRSRPMAAAATARGCACGRWNCRSSPMNSASPSPSATCRPAPASGTRSSTACSRSSPRNWRGKPLVSHQVIVQLIAATTTKTGLKVRCELDPNTYPAGIKVADAELAAVNLTRHDFHGEWNYTIIPKSPAPQQ